MLIFVEAEKGRAEMNFDDERQMIEFLSDVYFTQSRNMEIYGQTIKIKNYRFYQAWITAINNMVIKIHFKDFSII